MFDTIFEKCAVVSGLVAETEILSALKQMRDEGVNLTDETAEYLAQILIKRGFLNRWQAQQLLAGRARFNLGEYRIFDSIGHGGMGQVFKARHYITQKVVAVKVLPREKALRSQSAIDNFHREIQSLSRLHHSNIVSAIDAGMDGNVYYMVVEYVPGPDLRKLVRKRGPLKEATAINIIFQVAKGLSYAHRMGFVHRDIKPGNILVTLNGLAKLSDLGLASSPDSVDASSSKIVGTADYLCPDQVRRPNEPNPIWDVYSLGCALYFMVTGKVPYPNGGASEKIRRHLDPNTHPVNPTFHNPELSENFVNFLACMMAKNPQERIASADEVLRLASFWTDGTPKPLEFLNPEMNHFQDGQRYETDFDREKRERTSAGNDLSDAPEDAENEVRDVSANVSIGAVNIPVAPDSPYAKTCSIPAPPPVPNTEEARVRSSFPSIFPKERERNRESENEKNETKPTRNWGGFLKRMVKKTENN